MKRSVSLFVAAAVLLLGALFTLKVLRPVNTPATQQPAVQPADEKQPTKTEPGRMSMQAVDSSRLEQARDEMRAGIASASSVFRQFEPSQIQDESVRALSTDTFLRKRLVRTGGKYPLQIVRETVRRDAAGGYQVVSQVAMVADQVKVKLGSGISETDLEALAEQYKMSIAQKLKLPGYYVLSLKDVMIDSVDQAVQLLAAQSNVVELAEPNFIYFPTRTPNDTRFDELWGLEKIEAPAAWDNAVDDVPGDSSFLVAVLDTGISASHSDLIDNMWVNPGEAGALATNGVDDDANGYIDDWQGWDFYNNDNNPNDDNDHGTHVAGTIGAVGNNNRGVVGVCWDISLVGVKILGSDGFGTSDSEIVDAILYASDLGAKVQNNSWGGYGESQAVKEAIETVNANEVLFVAAAGNYNNDNDSNPFYPASYDLDNIVSVAASDQSDQLASFSHYGATTVDLAAPGVEILSTVPGGTYEAFDGTSMATPHVSGAIALLWSSNTNLNYLDVKNLLLESTDKLPSLSGKMVSGGRLNVSTLMAAAADEDKDGLPDDWETLYFGNPTAADPNADPDSDHLDNLGEYLNGTNPNVADTDTDSLVDGWEVTYGFNPLTPTGKLDSVDRIGIGTEDEASDVVVVDGYAYVADGEAGLVVIDVSDPSTPSRAASLNTAGFAGGIAVTNGVAYIADGTNGLVVVDVSTPTAPQWVGHLDTPGQAVRVDVQGAYAYVADGRGGSYSPYGGLEIINISTPSMPVHTGSYNASGQFVHDVYVQGSYAYLGTDNDTLIQLNVANPSSPGKVAFETIGSVTRRNIYSLYGNGTYLFAASADGIIGIFDMNLNPVGIDPGFPTEGIPRDVFATSNYLYVAEGNTGLEVFDITDINNPEQFFFYSTASGGEGAFSFGGGKAVFADGDTIYLADGESGLQIFGVAFDEDADGMLDSWEEFYFGDASQDPFDDFDGDGIINWGEYLAGLIPTNSDQDADGLIDGFDEVQTYNTDPRTSDTDTDGLSDYDEVNGTFGYVTDPLNPDTDGDGMTDGWEVDNGLNPLTDDAAADPDGDGVPNGDEYAEGTDPQNPDTDGDSMPDGWEIDNGLNPLVDDSLSDPDGDGLFNLYEYSLIAVSNWSMVYTNVPGAPSSFWFSTNGVPGFTDPNNPDSDADGLNDFFEITTNAVDNFFITNPNDPDTDGDGLPDKWEIDNGQNPTVPALSTDDSDGDGLTNGEEEDLGTDLANFFDPVFVDDDGPNDLWPYDTGLFVGDTNGFGPEPENGTISNAYDSIQEAINVASNGFTVLVNDGFYKGEGNYNIDPLGKSIVIRSWNGPDVTMVNSLGRGPVFEINSGETTNTVIWGLGLTVTINNCTDGDCDSEHVISLNGASPLIQDCYIFDARLDGIHCENGSSPVIVSNHISNVLNGIWCETDSSPRIEGCQIDNIGLNLAGDVGIGIYVDFSSGTYIGGDTVVSNCNGRGIVLKDSFDAVIEDTDVFECRGGITLDNSSPAVDRCIIRENDAPNYYKLNGVTVISSSLFPLGEEGYEETTDEDENGAGILMLRGASPVIRNCLIVQNKTWAEDPEYTTSKAVPDFGLGGGFYIGSGCSPTGVNCTVADNFAQTRGGGLSSHQSPFFRNMVFWGNSSSNASIFEAERFTTVYSDSRYQNLHCRTGNINIEYSNIEFGYPVNQPAYYYLFTFITTNNPLFVGEGDYQLLGTTSPCFNAGNFVDGITNDLNSVERPTSDDWPDRVDVGCYEFADNDGDGMANEWERRYRPDLDPEVFDANADPDGDGVSNIDEYTHTYNGEINATDPTDVDSDGDGLVDGFDGVVAVTNYPGGVDANTNGFVDGEMDLIYASDPNDPDTDDDGLTDGAEALVGTDPTKPDTDGDGMPDAWEVLYSPDLNPLADDANGDADGDELTNLFEYNAGTNPTEIDSDGDGMPDKWEVNNELDPRLNDADQDADSDGLTNLQEYEYVYSDIYVTMDVPTDPQNPDTDGDGISDGDEFTNGTNAHDPDTDGDGMPNGWEIDNDLDPDTNDAAADADGDGLTNLEEYQTGTDPNNPDTDGDGIPDDIDPNPLTVDLDLDGDGMPPDWELTNGLSVVINDALDDLDGDGLLNLYEYSLVSNSLWNAVYTNVPGAVTNFSYTDTNGLPVVYWPGSTQADSADSDGDGLTDLFEITTNGVDNLFITNPNNPDTDGDGLPDGWEVANYNPGPPSEINNPTTQPSGGEDSDGDGLTNDEEEDLGTNPADKFDPMYVDDDGPFDNLPGQAGNPDISDPDEDGTSGHPYDSIQEAITNAADGAMIFVLDGVYKGTGNFEITLDGKELRIINTNGAAAIETLGYGPAFVIDSGQTTNTVISGFIIETAGDLSPEEGIIVDGASPVLRDLVIRNCELEAVSCLNGAAPQILNCEFYDVEKGLVANGTGGLLFQEGLIYDTRGRGIVITGDDNAEITWSTISNCLGGITLSGSDAEIRQCIIRNNNAPNYFTVDGVETNVPVLLDLTNSLIIDVTSADENGAGILLTGDSSPLIQNCLIVENQTWAEDPAFSDTADAPGFGLGAGIYIPNGCNPTGVNCTVAYNIAQTRGGGIASAGRPVFRNMVIWDNIASNTAVTGTTFRATSPIAAYDNLHLIDQVINIWYSNVEGGYPNEEFAVTGNPLLTGTYELGAGSPCIDAGTYYLALKVDLAGNLRPTAWPDRIDVGCYEFGASAATNPIALGGELIQIEAVPDPLTDTDGDGYSDADEMALGTDRYESGDYFRITHDQSLQGGTAMIAWESQPGCTYTVQFTDSLLGEWTDVDGWIEVPGTGQPMVCEDTRDTEGSRFYRVLVRTP